MSDNEAPNEEPNEELNRRVAEGLRARELLVVNGHCRELLLPFEPIAACHYGYHAQLCFVYEVSDALKTVLTFADPRIDAEVMERTFDNQQYEDFISHCSCFPVGDEE